MNMNYVNQMYDFCKLMYSLGEDIRYYVECGSTVLTKEAYKQITGKDYDDQKAGSEFSSASASQPNSANAPESNSVSASESNSTSSSEPIHTSESVLQSNSISQSGSQSKSASISESNSELNVQ